MRYKRRSKEFSSLGVLDYLQTLTDESWDGLSAAGREKADNFVQLASAEYRRVGGSSEAALAGERVAQHLTRVDAGVSRNRAKKNKPVSMPVQLITAPGARASLVKLEYGSGRSIPAAAILRRMVAKMR